MNGAKPPGIFPLSDERKTCRWGSLMKGKSNLEKNKIWLQSTKIIFMENAGHPLKCCRAKACLDPQEAWQALKWAAALGWWGALSGMFQVQWEAWTLQSLPTEWASYNGFASRRETEVSASWSPVTAHRTMSIPTHTHTRLQGHHILSSCVLKPCVDAQAQRKVACWGQMPCACIKLNRKYPPVVKWYFCISKSTLSIDL